MSLMKQVIAVAAEPRHFSYPLYRLVLGLIEVDIFTFWKSPGPVPRTISAVPRRP